MIDIGAYLISITAFVLLIVFRQRWPKPLMPGKFVVDGFLAFVGAAALAPTGLGQWLISVLRAVLGWVVDQPAALAALLVLVALVVVVFDLWDRTADTPAIVALVTLPFLAAVAAGPLASGITDLYRQGDGVARSSVGSLIGGG